MESGDHDSEEPLLSSRSSSLGGYNSSNDNHQTTNSIRRDVNSKVSLPTNNEETRLVVMNGGYASNPPATSTSEGDANNDVDDFRDIVLLSYMCCGWPVLKLNRNVFWNLVADILYGISDSLLNGTVFVAYLKHLGREQNGPVGDIEAIDGMAMLISALPVGYLADRYGRDKIILCGAILFIMTGILHGGILIWIGCDETQLTESKRKTSLVIVAIVMALWGIGGGIVNGPVQALFADSTPAGDRSRYFYYLFVSYLFSSCCGPIASIILFQTLGDEWSFAHLRIILFVGLALSTCSAVPLMFFDDKKALDEQQEQVGSTQNDEIIPTTVTDSEVAAATTEQGDLGNALRTSHSRGGEIEHGQYGENDDMTFRDRYRWVIPYILFFSSLIFAIGSGLTVKFFPLFLKDDVHMSPTQVQIIYVIVPIVMALFSSICTNLASFIGRVESTLIMQFLGILCLYAMVIFKFFMDQHPVLLVPVYILHTALINCTYPILESMLMDFVPKHKRARWKSLESIAAFGWCGSAALGGYISDRWDYGRTFFITASIQVVATLLQACLLPLVPRHEQDLAWSNDNSGENG